MFEHITKFNPAYDKRNTDPKKNYGVHCVDLRMICKGEKGATQFVLYTGWYLPYVISEGGYKNTPMPADLGYHSLIPMYRNQRKIDCDLFSQGYCYYDGSSLNAERIYKILLEKGSDDVWMELEKYYNELFLND